MKVTLEFDDQDEAMTALNAVYWKSVVFNLDQYLRILCFGASLWLGKIIT
jgi:hypothetical protein